MKKRILLKVFFAYSYLSAICYIGSEQALKLAHAKKKVSESEGLKMKIRVESLWKTTLSRIKEVWKIMSEI